MSDILTTQLKADTAMFGKARDMGVKGVAVSCIVSERSLSENYQQLNLSIIVVDRFQRPPKANDEKGDVGTNYLAVATAKFAQMLDTLRNSGTTPDRIPKTGENNFRGGLVERSGDYWLFAAFSGGSEYQDVEIASTGIEKLKEFRPFDYS